MQKLRGLLLENHMFTPALSKKSGQSDRRLATSTQNDGPHGPPSNGSNPANTTINTPTPSPAESNASESSTVSSSPPRQPLQFHSGYVMYDNWNHFKL